jgi:hypothetical protein
MDFDLFGCWFTFSSSPRIGFTSTGDRAYKWMLRLPFVTITRLW